MIEDHLGYCKLAVGDTAVWEGEPYLLQGRLRWSMLYKEYYKEKDSSGYSTEFWEYDEWQLQNLNTQEFIYLIEDAEGYYLAKEIEPNLTQYFPPDGDPYQTYISFFDNHPLLRVQEYGDVSFRNSEGEVVSSVALDEKKYFCTYFYDRVAYSCEMPIKPNGYVDEAEQEYYEQIKLTKEQMLSLFPDNDRVKSGVEGIKTWAFARNLSFIASIISFVLFIYAFFPQKTIYSEEIPLNKLSDTSAYITKTWQIDNINQVYVYELEIKNMTYSGNLAETFIAVDVFDKQSNLKVGSLIGDFFEERGVDSDGSWVEGSYYNYSYLRGDDKGTFFAEIYAETTPLQSAFGTGGGGAMFPSGTVVLKIRHWTVLWYYILPAYIFFSLLTLILHLILAKKDNSYALFKKQYGYG